MQETTFSRRLAFFAHVRGFRSAVSVFAAILTPSAFFNENTSGYERIPLHLA
jgi:hypothetical protein